MKILLVSHGFAPQVGGIETMSIMLAREFVKAGHEVRVVTHSPSDSVEIEPYEILRSPSKRQLLESVRWCEVVFHNNICLQFAWPLFFIRRPWVVSHHTSIRRPSGKLGPQDAVKRLLIKRVKQIAVSQALANDFDGRQAVIGNCYQDDVFKMTNSSIRDQSLIFVGRLVNEKGVDIAIRALGMLKHVGLGANLTIVGDGPERQSLEELAHDLALSGQVRFVGTVLGPELAALMNQHRIMLLPTRTRETFGIAALEGIACGCAVVGSDGGGLKDAIGPCGLTFPNGDLEALVERLKELLTDRSRLDEFRKAAPAHLAQHRPESVAAKYLAVLQEAIG